jgi:dihydropteroate synthase
MEKRVNIKGKLLALDTPVVMGILNVTPDSFYAGSRKQTAQAINERIAAILEEGGGMVDVGGYSSRPDAAEVTPDEEMKRLAFALDIIRKHYPEVTVSVDTFRADIARRCVEEYGAALVNDISGGDADKAMFETVADLHIPYILMHMRGNPQTMERCTDYADVADEVIRDLSEKVSRLRLLGVNDIILDPGFGFGKTLEQNYELMRRLDEFELFEMPLLVGISRKRMVYSVLESSPEESLSGTVVLNTFALLKGADILRVHDVREAVDTVRIVQKLKNMTH